MKAPRCEKCDGILRPDAVLFGEMLPEDKLSRVHAELEDEVPDLVLSVGTTAVFPYIQRPIIVAKQKGRLTVEINPEKTILSEIVDYSLRGTACELLPSIADRIGHEFASPEDLRGR